MANTSTKIPLILSLQEMDRSKQELVGNKGANLGELARLKNIHVPDGFCITTEAYKRILRQNTSIKELLYKLSVLKILDRDKISVLSAEVRKAIETATIPQELIEEISLHLFRLGDNKAYAVRSSATAEDLPGASFAGQQDTYLNIIGKEAILEHISRCWASLFTERAILYRIHNGFKHDQVYLSVLIQEMVFAQASGIMFTADPLTSNRKVLSIDAGFGLGEALVSGLVNADNYKVRDGRIIDKSIAAKNLVINALKEGGTKEQEVEPGKQEQHVLADEHVLQLERIGRKIENHFGHPQDIEWCLADDNLFIVQSRPITTLFPIPGAAHKENHVYISVGHQQMMTDAMKPLGLSFFLLMTNANMCSAGGRLFVDITADLESPSRRNVLVNVLGKSDPLIRDALMTILEREDFIKSLPPGNQERDPGTTGNNREQTPLPNYQVQIEYDPEIVPILIKNREASIEELKRNIQSQSGLGLFSFILDDIQNLKSSLADPRSFNVFMTAMNASYWINDKMQEWLGEKNVADILTQSVPNNITSKMGLALLDVADVIRPYPELVAYLQKVQDESFLENLVQFNGGERAKEAITGFLHKFGMRCAGEIDITRPRWSERPAALIPLLLSNIKNFEPGASRQKFEQGKLEALQKEQEILSRLSVLPGGDEKARETKRMIELVRNYSGYREYPKYSLVSRYFIYKQALLKEAGRLVQAGVLQEKEDIYYLSFEELQEVVRTNVIDYQLITKRKDEYRLYEKLTPPRVITSDGEIITGAYKRENITTGAIVGLAVSSGLVEGRARVILNMENADLQPGDILVTRFTDPSWTPLFLSIKGLITEVGGLMTHGAVIAREYGIPAVVGVEHATSLIKDGQQIRVHGTEGYIEILDTV